MKAVTEMYLDRPNLIPRLPLPRHLRDDIVARFASTLEYRRFRNDFDFSAPGVPEGLPIPPRSH